MHINVIFFKKRKNGGYVMSREEIIHFLIENYGVDKEELQSLDLLELKEMLDDYEDHSDFFPNGDEYDGSHSYD
jgi:hypothetical protein